MHTPFPFTSTRSRLKINHRSISITSPNMSYIAPHLVLIGTLLFILPTTYSRHLLVRSSPAPPKKSQPLEPIPADKAMLEPWFRRTVGKLSAINNGPQSLSSGPPKVINVPGQFKTILQALGSIPNGNKKRVIIAIAPGNYSEKIKIEEFKPFVTFYGTDPKNRPVLVYGDTARKVGTAESGTLNVQADYFTMVNMRIVNSAPKPDGKMKDAMAVAMRIMGEYATFYNCAFHGFQDTLMDDMGKHFFKDCYIEGTVDFIFGSGMSLYLNCEIHVMPGVKLGVITASARETAAENKGYVFVHSRITGTAPAGKVMLGRAWFDYARVIFAYCELGDVVDPKGWSNNNDPKASSTVFFGEYKNMGPGASLKGREPFTKKLTPADMKPYLDLTFIEASTWLQLPPAI